MKHSFIIPRTKKVVGVELKWLIVFFIALLSVMLLLTLWLNSTIALQAENLQAIKIRTASLVHEEKEMHHEMLRLKDIEKIRETITTKNQLNRENVKNFFDLVPDDVILEMAELRQGSLHLKGNTKSKKHFNQTFQRSLNSLAKRSSTKFKRNKNGTYQFTNLSILETEK